MKINSFELWGKNERERDHRLAVKIEATKGLQLESEKNASPPVADCSDRLLNGIEPFSIFIHSDFD